MLIGLLLALGMLGVLRHGNSVAGRGDPLGRRRQQRIWSRPGPAVAGAAAVALPGGHRARRSRLPLQVAALRLVPIYVVAAAIAASLAVTAIVAAWVLSTRLSASEWAAVGVVCASLAMLGLAAGPEGIRHGPAGLAWALLVVVAACSSPARSRGG